MLILRARRFANRSCTFQQLIESGIEAGAAQFAIVGYADDCESGERDDEQDCQQTENAQHRGDRYEREPVNCS